MASAAAAAAAAIAARLSAQLAAGGGGGGGSSSGSSGGSGLPSVYGSGMSAASSGPSLDEQSSDPVVRARAIAARLNMAMGGVKRKADGEPDYAWGSGGGEKRSKKLYIPVEQHPNINFMGLLIGPKVRTRANTHARTHCMVVAALDCESASAVSVAVNTCLPACRARKPSTWSKSQGRASSSAGRAPRRRAPRRTRTTTTRCTSSSRRTRMRR
jgi:hypothetical protein